MLFPDPTKLISIWQYSSFGEQNFTIPCNGYLYVNLETCIMSGHPSGQTLSQIINLNNQRIIFNSCCSTEGKFQNVWIPVKKGDVINYITYRTLNFNEGFWAYFRLFNIRR